MVIYNIFSTVFLALIVLITLCVLVLRIFNRHKLVNKYFNGIEENLYIFSVVNIVCIICDIRLDQDLTDTTLCSTLMSVYIAIVVVLFICFILYMGYQSTKNIRSKFKDY